MAGNGKRQLLYIQCMACVSTVTNRLVVISYVKLCKILGWFNTPLLSGKAIYIYMYIYIYIRLIDSTIRRKNKALEKIKK